LFTADAGLSKEAGAEDIVGGLIGVEFLHQVWVASHDSALADRAFFGDLAGVDRK
jgi:hypothetical protein